MKDIAHRLNAYIQKHPFNSGDSDCETVLDQLYQAYAESHESDPAEIGNGLRSWKSFCVNCRWKIIMWCSICAAACAAPTNAKHFWTVCNMAHI